MRFQTRSAFELCPMHDRRGSIQKNTGQLSDDAVGRAWGVRRDLGVGRFDTCDRDTGI